MLFDVSVVVDKSNEGLSLDDSLVIAMVVVVVVVDSVVSDRSVSDKSVLDISVVELVVSDKSEDWVKVVVTTSLTGVTIIVLSSIVAVEDESSVITGVEVMVSVVYLLTGLSCVVGVSSTTPTLVEISVEVVVLVSIIESVMADNDSVGSTVMVTFNVSGKPSVVTTVGLSVSWFRFSFDRLSVWVVVVLSGVCGLAISKLGLVLSLLELALVPLVPLVALLESTCVTVSLSCCCCWESSCSFRTLADSNA